MTARNLKTALVTGGTRGIGLAVARRLVALGYRVVIVGRVFDAKDDSGKRIEFWEQDLGTKEGLSAFLNRLDCIEFFDTVVHAIGGTLHVGEEAKTDDWLRVHWLNFQVPVEINRYLLKGELSPRRVLHLSSSAAFHGKASMPYVCSKSALNAYIKAKGSASLRSGIAIAGIAPAAVKGHGGVWDRVEEGEVEKVESVGASQALGRFQTADEVADFVGWFCGDSGILFGGQVLLADAFG